MSDAAVGGCPVQAGFDPLSAEALADPMHVLASLPEDEPVFYAPAIDYFVVTRYADVEAVFRDPETFSAAAAQLPMTPLTPEAQQTLLDGGHRPQPSMVSLDPPDHDRLRGPAARAFTPARVAAMEGPIRDRTRLLLDAIGAAPVFDIVEAIAFPLPALTIFHMLGVPDDDIAQLKEWCGARALLTFGRPAPEQQLDIATNIVTYRRYLRELVAAKREQPGDDLTSALLDDPTELAPEEIASILFSLSFAGHETTTNLIGNSMRRLLEEPARWAALVAHPALIPGAIEEVLRYDSSVPIWRRLTTRPTMLGGVDLPAGAKLLLWLAAAGRDPDMFSDPDTFDLQRPNARHHIAFGKGIHFCLGANLSRLELKVVLEELTQRYPSLRVVEDQSIVCHPNMSFRGPERLLVRA
jgi:cytochrome P450